MLEIGGQLSEELQRRFVCPLGVVDHQDSGVDLRQGEQRLPDRTVQPLRPCVRLFRHRFRKSREPLTDSRHDSGEVGERQPVEECSELLGPEPG